MNTITCGIDFGTSNSSVALASAALASGSLAEKKTVSLVPVENNSVTIPSAIFFQRNQIEPKYGREAIQLFLAREEGRFMRSLKRVLGTPVMTQGTMVNGRFKSFPDIIASFLKHLKAKAELHSGTELRHVVMGRPVHFQDNNPAADQQAELELKKIATSVGFEFVEFQFEPIAAAFAHEVNVDQEKLAIVVDLGGGTSDFSIIRLAKNHIGKSDRSGDILANTGVRIGGNDFDKDLSLSEIMPELGYKSTYGDKHIEVPLKPFHDLSGWSKVNFLYTPKMLMQTRQLLAQSHAKPKYQRLLHVLEQESGHTLLAAAEEAKIALTSDHSYQMPFDFLENGFTIDTQRSRFEQAVRHEIEKISASALECIRMAGIRNEEIDLVILTGGTTEVPAVQEEFRTLFPQAEVADENKLSSVGLGLAYDSIYKFGTR